MAVSEYLKLKWRQAFKFFDVDNDGVLTTGDFGKFADNISLRTGASPSEAERTKEEWLKWFRVMQPDPSVIVDEERYVASCAEFYQDVENHKKLITATASDIFDRIDLNSDGSISIEELGIFYGSVRIGQKDLVYTVFKDLDKDDNGSIDRAEFIEALVRHFTNPDPVDGYSVFFGIPNQHCS